MEDVRLRPLALADIRETCRYLSREASAEIANRFFHSVRDSAITVASFPRIGATCRFGRPELADLRRWPVKGFDRWHLFYFPRSGWIDVARVLHSARDLDAIFDPVQPASNLIED